MLGCHRSGNIFATVSVDVDLWCFTPEVCVLPVHSSGLRDDDMQQQQLYTDDTSLPRGSSNVSLVKLLHKHIHTENHLTKPPSLFQKYNKEDKQHVTTLT